MLPLDNPSPHPKQHLRRFSLFAQFMAECPCTLKWATTLPLKLSLCMGVSGHPSNTWFPCPIPLRTQMASRSVQPFLQRVRESRQRVPTVYNGPALSSRLTHSYLLNGDDSPTCQSCGIPLTVKHILVEYANLRDIREKYFTVSSLADLFDRVDNHTVKIF